MATHEFGILSAPPLPDQRFDEYEPEKYACIAVDDEQLFPLLDSLMQCACYGHSLQNPIRGLEYTGISLIPPETLPRMASILESCPEPGLSELLSLVRRAQAEGRYVIHFGI